MTGLHDDAPWMQWTSTSRILELHELGIARHGGPKQVADASGCVDGAVGSAYSSELYLEGRKHAKAGLLFSAHLLLYLVLRHCFLDGNKRIAWTACTDALAAQGLGVTAGTDEAYAFMSAVIERKIGSGEEVAAWLAPRLYAL